MTSPETVILALGSNLGDSAETLAAAVRDIADHPGITLTRLSPVAQSKPVGGPVQPDYLNMVIEVTTELAPLEVLDLCQEIELLHHRERKERWGARTLDIDVIVYGTDQCDDDRLTLPHPRAAERAFVLQPWLWMDPDAQLLGRSVAELAAQASDRDKIRRYEPSPPGESTGA